MQEITFLEFCARNFVPGYAVNIFKAWLGDKADESMSENEWLELWAQFVKEKREGL